MTPKSRTRRVRCALSLYAQPSPLLPHHQFHELGFAAALPLPPLSQALLCALLCSVGLCGANAGATRPARGARSRVWRRRGASRRPARDDPPGKGEAEAALLLPGGGRRGRPPPPRRRSHAACCPAPPVALVIRPRNLSGPLFLFLSFLFFSSTFLTLIVFSSLAAVAPFWACVFPRFFLRGGGWRPTRRPLGARSMTHLSRLTALARRRCGRDRAWRRLGTLVAGGARGRTKAPEADGPEPPAPALRCIGAATVRTRTAALRARPQLTALTRIIIMAGRSPTRRAAHFLMIRSQSSLSLKLLGAVGFDSCCTFLSTCSHSLDVPLWRRRWSWQAPRARA